MENGNTENGYSDFGVARITHYTIHGSDGSSLKLPACPACEFIPRLAPTTPLAFAALSLGVLPTPMAELVCQKCGRAWRPADEPLAVLTRPEAT